MKIIHFLYELVSGGAERFVVDLANAQAAGNHDVTVCILRPLNDRSGFNRQFLSPQVGFRSLGVESGISPAKLRVVKDYFLSERPDVIHCHHNILPYLTLLAFNPRKPVIVHTVHSAAERANKNSVERCLTEFMYKRRIVRPVTISSECNASFARVYGFSADCIVNGRAEYTPGRDSESVKQEIAGFRATDNTKVFVHVGRCHPVKNQQMLIDVFNALDKEGVDFTLLVLGAAFDAALGQEIVKRACPKIHFLGEKSNVADYLMNSDAFCLTSLSEGLSISLLEAIQCGLTPICTPVGGNPDVVIDGKTGYLSADLSQEAYLYAIHRYLDHPLDKAAQKQYFKENFSMETCCAKYVALYEKMIH